MPPPHDGDAISTQIHSILSSLTRNTVTLAEFCGFLRNKDRNLCTHKLRGLSPSGHTGLFTLSQVSYAGPARKIPSGRNAP